MRIAIFDFDGTLYKKETFKLLIEHLKKHPTYSRNYPTFFRSIVPRYIGSKLKIYPEHKMRMQLMQSYVAALDRLSKEEIDRYFTDIAKVMRPHFNQVVINRLNEHRQNGLHLILVSGAFTSLLNQFKRDFHFDMTIGTNIPFLKGEVNKTELIDHIQGQRKVEKIKDILHDKDVNWKESFAYADSFSDLPVLNLVGHPVAVNPDKNLYDVAKKLHWEVI